MQSNLIIFLLSFFLFSFSAAAEELPEGWYIYNNAYSSKGFLIRKNYEFEYFLSDCTTRAKGFGTYKLDNKILTFTFSKFKNYTDTTKIEKSNNNDNLVNIHCFSIFDSLPKEKVQIKLGDDSLTLETDSKGNTNFELTKSKFPLKVEAIYKYSNHKSSIYFELSEIGSYNIKIPIRDVSYDIDGNLELKYLIKSFKKNKLRLNEVGESNDSITFTRHLSK